MKDIAANVSWTPVSEPDLMLVHVVAAKVVVEPTADAAATTAAPPAAAAEPEVMKKGKTDKEGDDKDKSKK